MAVTWMKRGKAAQQMLDQEETKAQQKAEQTNKMFRYWMPANTEGCVTFLDGDLDKDGVLSCPMFYEHQVYMNGSWRNWFVCTQDEEPCPVCASGVDPQLIAVFTVIDHSEYTTKAGKTYKNQKRLFVAKRNTFKKLQKIAQKRGGLTGCTFDVSRTGDKEASVGDVFDFTEKSTPDEIAAKYGLEDVSPADYENEIVYRTAKELREKFGFETEVTGQESDPADTDFNDDL